MPKKIKNIPKPKTNKTIDETALRDFENNGVGHDKKPHTLKSTNEGLRDEELKRISVDVPKTVRKKYKSVCHDNDTTMVADIKAFIHKRITELEGD